MLAIYTWIHDSSVPVDSRKGAVDSIWSLLYCFFVCAWGVIWREFWYRKNAALVYRWGTKGVRRAERVRSEFRGHEDGCLAIEATGDGQFEITPNRPITFGQHSTLVFSARCDLNLTLLGAF